MATTKAKRIQPVRRKVRQLDWIMQWFIRTHDCAICAEPLLKGYDKRNPGQSITLHHTEGGRETDDWDNMAYVAKMVPCHKTCHRSYHLSLRHSSEGKNVDHAKLARMEANIQNTVKEQEK